MSEYILRTDGRRVWCNSHQRVATHLDPHGRPCCDPTLGGIMIPCGCVDVTDDAEIEGGAGDE